MMEEGYVSLYTLLGKRLFQIEESFTEFSPRFRFSFDGELVVVFFDSNLNSGTDYFRLYDSSGKIIADKLEGYFQEFSPDGELLVATSSNTNTSANNELTFLYSRHGNQQTVLQGQFKAFSQNGQYILTDRYLYNRSGEEIANIENANFLGISPNTEQLVVRKNNGQSCLYSFTDEECVDFNGSFRGFSPDGSRIVFGDHYGDYSPNDSFSYLYSGSGNQLAELQGHLIEFSPNNQYLLTYSQEKQTVYLYDSLGNPIREFNVDSRYSPETRFLFSSAGRYFVISYHAEDVSRMFDLSGNLVSEFPGIFQSFSTDGKLIHTRSQEVPYIDHVLSVDTGLSELITRGCNLLQDYFVTHPESLKNLSICGD